MTFFPIWGRFHSCGHFHFWGHLIFWGLLYFRGHFYFLKLSRHTHRQIYRDLDIITTDMLRAAMVKNSIRLKLSIWCQWLNFISPGIKSGEQLLWIKVGTVIRSNVKKYLRGKNTGIYESFDYWNLLKTNIYMNWQSWKKCWGVPGAKVYDLPVPEFFIQTVYIPSIIG